MRDFDECLYAFCNIYDYFARNLAILQGLNCLVLSDFIIHWGSFLKAKGGVSKSSPMKCIYIHTYVHICTYVHNMYICTAAIKKINDKKKVDEV